MDSENLKINFPETDKKELAQDQEFCVLQEGNTKRKIRFHDYHEIYSTPGLYEKLFYDKLKCCSPQKISGILKEEMEESPIEMSDLKVLDIGAGNGMMGEELVKDGVESVVGIDIIEEAKEAQERDRPGVYDGYHVMDLTEIDDETRGELQEEHFNCLTTVAALGFGDIPPCAFIEGFNLIEDQGIVAFNIKDKFVEKEDSSGFSRMIDSLEEKNILNIKAKDKYCHRLAVDGTPLYYYAMVGTKERDIPEELVKKLC